MIKLLFTAILSFICIQDKNNVIFIAGSDTRSWDITATQQARLLQKGYIKEPKTFRFNVSTSELNNYIKTKNNITVFLFSAGCRKTLDVIKSPYIDARKVYVIEPYATDSGIRSTIRQSVNLGLPRENIFVGPTRDRGLGILGTETVSLSEADEHLNSLEIVGNIIRNKEKSFFR